MLLGTPIIILAAAEERLPFTTMQDAVRVCIKYGTNKANFAAILTKNNILDFSTTAGVPGGAIGGALGGIVKQNCTFHFSWLV